MFMRPPSQASLPHLSSQDDIARLSPAFLRPLNDEFDLAALSGHLCPVVLRDGTAAIFLLADYAAGDQVDELERLIVQRGYRMARPSRYLLPAPLLLAVARGQLGADQLRNRRAVLADRHKSALAAAFVDLVAWGVRQDASDVHFNVFLQRAESEVRYTLGGIYVAPPRFRHMPTGTLMEILAVAWMDVRGGNGAVFDPRIEQQGRLDIEVDGKPVILRWASLAADTGPAVCLRVLRPQADDASWSLRALGYLDTQIGMLRRACLAEGGAVVLAGAVGAGKSTTIAALIRSLPATRKVITLEDPVEYLIANALQNTVGRRLDESVPSVFDAKLRTIKRCAMHDLLVGEIRDAETGRAFMDLAGSGVNLYTTTHASAAWMIPERLASDFIGVSRDFLAIPGVLKLLVWQALLPRLCAACALPLDALYRGADGARHRAWAARLLGLYALDGATLRVRNPAGCPACAQADLPQLLGLNGRTVVAEMIEPGLDEAFLCGVRQRDYVRLRQQWRERVTAPVTDADMRGKSAMACALYKASLGQIDPRDIESRFGAFETVALERAAWKETSHA
ncbi:MULTISPECIES: ATPase, T2SS/T4P/T4SS family [unclassified Achromobacter]|uniref:ATPase, T2SS/T4P/T4SS family n=1 Tax=unclassified Achromobacter TaxID=2626865 RepID=UPI000B51A7EA|nr:MULTISPECIES: ATPase, T2SS/T4P/T4SS family [unclassified Achromobacter]OWT77268.1 general secretion pathway protein [Achromobacter sp. HZ28]OWT78149.1 general secretion pathway protein [Achromobacter sp. HZ34]